jgi:hypothetical protein
MLLRKIRAARDLQFAHFKITKGMASRSSRQMQKNVPLTWQFSGFSQNQEDGIVDELLLNLKYCNKYLIEIGCSDGIENNSSWHIFTNNYSGLLIDSDKYNIERSYYWMHPLCPTSRWETLFVTPISILPVLQSFPVKNPDFFSLDIDSFDFDVAKEILTSGFRPKIFLVEYNSAYGPETLTHYSFSDFTKKVPINSKNWGCSISKWNSLFEEFDYKFVTVDESGVNAFFVDPTMFIDSFNPYGHGLSFANSKHF